MGIGQPPIHDQPQGGTGAEGPSVVKTGCCMTHQGPILLPRAYHMSPANTGTLIDIYMKGSDSSMRRVFGNCGTISQAFGTSSAVTLLL